MPKDIVATSAGQNRRGMLMSQCHYRPKPITPTSGGYGVTSEELEEQIDRAIQKVHCRLLETATSGRLTFIQDQIIRRDR